nr:hypothetical protein Iba_chr14aCG6930 [Ipomoea batatas]
MASSPHPRRRFLQAASFSSSGVVFFKQRPAQQLASSPHPRRSFLQAASCSIIGVASCSSSRVASSVASSPHPRRCLLQRRLLVKWRRILNGVVSSSTASPSSSSILLIKWRRLRIHGWRHILNGVVSSSTASLSSSSVLLIKWGRLRIHGVAFFKQRPTQQLASSPHPWRRLLQVASCSTIGVSSCSSSRVAFSMVSSPHPRRCLFQRRRILNGVVSSSTASPSSSSVLLIKWRRLLQVVSCLSSGAASSMASSPHPQRRLLQAVSCLSSGATSAMASSPHPRCRLLQAASCSSSGVVSASTASPSPQWHSPKSVSDAVWIHAKVGLGGERHGHIWGRRMKLLPLELLLLLAGKNGVGIALSAVNLQERVESVIELVCLKVRKHIDDLCLVSLQPYLTLCEEMSFTSKSKLGSMLNPTLGGPPISEFDWELEQQTNAGKMSKLGRNAEDEEKRMLELMVSDGNAEGMIKVSATAEKRDRGKGRGDDKRVDDDASQMKQEPEKHDIKGKDCTIEGAERFSLTTR